MLHPELQVEEQDEGQSNCNCMMLIRSTSPQRTDNSSRFVREGLMKVFRRHQQHSCSGCL